MLSFCTPYTFHGFPFLQLLFASLYLTKHKRVPACVHRNASLSPLLTHNSRVEQTLAMISCGTQISAKGFDRGGGAAPPGPWQEPCCGPRPGHNERIKTLLQSPPHPDAEQAANSAAADKAAKPRRKQTAARQLWLAQLSACLPYPRTRARAILPAIYQAWAGRPQPHP